MGYRWTVSDSKFITSERFGSMTRIYYQYAIAAVICFDISRPSTLDNVRKWRDDINEKVQLPDGKPIPMLLLANKCDIPDVRIDKEKLDHFAKENGFMGWFETSSKSSINVETAFNSLVEVILKTTKDKKVERPDQRREGTINVVEQQNPKISPRTTSGCCG